MDERILTLRVERVRAQTPDVRAFELVHPLGHALPAFDPGAHLHVHVPGGFSRPYSLVRPADGAQGASRYVIGVKREPASRGGSASLHERVRAGDLLAVSVPRNTFPLHPGASHHLLLAGGIGMTPMLCMAQHLARKGADFTLFMFARSREHLAFADALERLGQRVRLHLDQPADAPKIDLRALLAVRPAGAHLYLCGPAGFMAAARAAAAQAWPEEAIHLEYFAPPSGAHAQAQDEPFTLRLRGRGIDVPVAADQTAVQALHELGIDVPTSCEQGVCGTCVVPLAGEEADHRDYCLGAGERRTKVALCCSRAKGAVLEIGL